MNLLVDQPLVDENKSKIPFINKLKSKKNKIMKAPCSHKFHINCLVDWMAIKMQCPTCRQPLPPF